MRCVGSCVCSVVISGTSGRTTRLRAPSSNVFDAEPTGRRSLVTRDFGGAARPAPSRPAKKATPPAAEEYRGIQRRRIGCAVRDFLVGPSHLVYSNMSPAYLLECSNVWLWLMVGVRSAGVTIRGRIRSFGPGSLTSWRVGSIWLDCAGLTDSRAHTAAAVAIGGQARGCGCAPTVG